MEGNTHTRTQLSLMTFRAWLLAGGHGWMLDTLKWEDQDFLSRASFHGSGNMEGKRRDCFLSPLHAANCCQPLLYTELQTSVTHGPATTWQRRRRRLPLMRIGPLGKRCPLKSHPGLIWKDDGANASRHQSDKALVLRRFGAPWWWRVLLKTMDVQRPGLVKVLSRLGTMGVLYKPTSTSLSYFDIRSLAYITDVMSTAETKLYTKLYNVFKAFMCNVCVTWRSSIWK